MRRQLTWGPKYPGQQNQGIPSLKMDPQGTPDLNPFECHSLGMPPLVPSSLPFRYHLAVVYTKHLSFCLLVLIKLELSKFVDSLSLLLDCLPH